MRVLQMLQETLDIAFVYHRHVDGAGQRSMFNKKKCDILLGETHGAGKIVYSGNITYNVGTPVVSRFFF